MSESAAERYGRALESLPAEHLEALKDMKGGRYVAPQELGGFPSEGKSLIAKYNGRATEAEVASKYGRPPEPEKQQEQEKSREKEPAE